LGCASVALERQRHVQPSVPSSRFEQRAVLGANYAATYAGDFNGDGRPDLIQIAYNYWDVQILIGNGDGTFTQIFRQPYGATAPFWKMGYSLTYLADVNGDGRSDVIQVGTNWDAQVLLSNGDGTFTQVYHQADSNSGPFWGSGYANSYVIDVNGDGKADLIQNANSYWDVQVLLGNGTEPLRRRSGSLTGRACRSGRRAIRPVWSAT